MRLIVELEVVSVRAVGERTGESKGVSVSVPDSVVQATLASATGKSSVAPPAPHGESSVGAANPPASPTKAPPASGDFAAVKASRT